MRTIAALLLLAGAAAAQPKRIVSTAPSITEMLFALNLGERVVGVTNYCTYPPQASRKAKIGGYANPSVEAILALRPDLILVYKNPGGLTARLRSMGLNAIEVDPHTIPGIYASIEQIGQAAGVPGNGRKLAQSIRSELESIRTRTARLPRKKVMFLVGRTPRTLEGLIAVGRTSYHNDLIEAAGGENIFRDAVAPYPKVTIEEVLSRDPDVIIDMGDVPRASGATEEHKKSVVALWSRYPSLKAVRHGGVHAVASDALVVAGPRAAEAARIFARIFYPKEGF